MTTSVRWVGVPKAAGEDSASVTDFPEISDHNLTTPESRQRAGVGEVDRCEDARRAVGGVGTV